MAAFIADPHVIFPGNRMRYPPMIGYEMCDKRDQMIIEYLQRMTGPDSPSEDSIPSLPEPAEGDPPFDPCV